MYTCTYVYMYICIYVYTYICIYAYVCIYVHMYICAYVHMYIYFYVCVSEGVCVYSGVKGEGHDASGRPEGRQHGEAWRRQCSCDMFFFA